MSWGSFVNGLGDFFGAFRGAERQQGEQHEHELALADRQAIEFDKQREWQAAENEARREQERYIADLQLEYAKASLMHQQTLQKNYLDFLADNNSQYGGSGYGSGSSAGYGGGAGYGTALPRDRTTNDTPVSGNYRPPTGGQGDGYGSTFGGFGGGYGATVGGGYGAPVGGGFGLPTSGYSGGYGTPSAGVGGGFGSPIGGNGYNFANPYVSPTFANVTPGQGFYAPSQPPAFPPTQVGGPQWFPVPPNGPPNEPTQSGPSTEPEQTPLFDLSDEDGYNLADTAYQGAFEQIDDHRAKVDEWVADGTLSQEEGDGLKAELDQRKTDLTAALEDKDSQKFSDILKSTVADVNEQESQAARHEKIKERAEGILAEIDRLEENGKISAESAETARADVNKGLEDSRSSLVDLDQNFGQDYGGVSEDKVLSDVETFLGRIDEGLHTVEAKDGGFDAKEEADGVANGTSAERIKTETENLKW